MSTNGQAAWSKHFKGKGTVRTTLKKASSVYDPQNGTKKIADLEAGTEIVYLETKKFEPKALITFSKNRRSTQGRVQFDNIAKPGVKSSGASSLKPQAFKVGDTAYSSNIYKKIVLDALDDRTDLDPAVRTYLHALFDYYAGGATTEAKVKKIFAETKGNIPISDINKDFGEVLGPIAIITKGLLKSKKIRVDAGSKIYIPSRPNEPLMDYKVGKYVISAKSGNTTNVVKPGDILSLLEKDSVKLKKWQKTKEYKILDILRRYSIRLGPIMAVSTIHPELIPPSAITSLTDDNYLDALRGFIKKNDYLKSKKSPTLNEIMYECEKILTADSKSGRLSFTKIFADAIENQVIYVRFEVGPFGTGKWEIDASDDFKSAEKSVYLRSKNGYNRDSDRMGIQV